MYCNSVRISVLSVEKVHGNRRLRHATRRHFPTVSEFVRTPSFSGIAPDTTAGEKGPSPHTPPLRHTRRAPMHGGVTYFAHAAGASVGRGAGLSWRLAGASADSAAMCADSRTGNHGQSAAGGPFSPIALGLAVREYASPHACECCIWQGSARFGTDWLHLAHKSPI